MPNGIKTGSTLGVTSLKQRNKDVEFICGENDLGERSRAIMALLLVYINDIVDDLESNISLFADDTSLSLEIDNPDICAMQLQSDIDKITEWAQKWIVKFNLLKSESLVITRKLHKPTHPDLFMSNTKIPVVQNHKHLGIFISDDCTWD